MARDLGKNAGDFIREILAIRVCFKTLDYEECSLLKKLLINLIIKCLYK